MSAATGHLQILNGRNLATRVMSNGVEVIVKGGKTDYILGFGPEKTPSLTRPLKAKHTTYPPSTVSRQFHLVEQSGKPYQQINHLLHSIVRSVTPDLITKTMVTTFTYMTTMLDSSSTVVNTREQVISNVVTEKFRPTALYTANLKAEPSPLAPLLEGDDAETLYSSYVTNTLMTTYTYYNAFTAGSVPIVLTSKETVSNVLTVPAYLASPTPLLLSPQPFSSRVFETETYYTTFTFSKTLAEQNTNRIVTTLETVTQVVVTEAFVPASSPVPMSTPEPTPVPETRFTTFTFFTTSLEGSSSVLKSSTRVTSEVVTPMLVTPSLTIDVNPTLMIPTESVEGPSVNTSAVTMVVSPTIMEPSRPPVQPVIIYATKTYYTTYTYFTTVLGEGSSTKVNSRVQVASKVVTEALSTRGPLGTDYLQALKSSYLAKHSTMMHVSSSIKEIIPAKTESVFTMSRTLVTQSISHPHYPKDEDLPGYLDPTTPTSGSAEHYEEMKEGISHIVSVLADSQNEYEVVSPSTVDPLFSTVVAPTTVVNLGALASNSPEDDEADSTTESSIEYSSRVSHRPTPPLSKVSLTPSSSIADGPFDDNLFTMVTGLPMHAIVYEEEYEGTTEKEAQKEPNYGSGSVEDTPLAQDGHEKVSLTADSLESGLILTPSILNKLDIAGPPEGSQQVVPLKPSDMFVTKVPVQLIKPTPTMDRTQQIFDMLSEIMTGQENSPDYYDETKEQDAFAEHFSEETTTKKVYSLSPNVTDMAVKVKKPSKPKPKPPMSSILYDPFTIETEMTTEPPTLDLVAPLTPAPPPSTVSTKGTTTTTTRRRTTTEKPTTKPLSTDAAQESDVSVTTQAPPRTTTSKTTTARRTTTTTTRRPTTTESGLAIKLESFDNVGAHGQTHHVTTSQTYFPDIGQVVIRLTSAPPEEKTTRAPPTRRSTTRPRKKPKPPKPTHSTDVDLDQKIYNLGQAENSDSSAASDEDSKDEEEQPDTEDNSEAADESDEFADVRRPQRPHDTAHDHPSGPPPISAPPISGTGPSKSSGILSSGTTGGSHVLSTSSNGINWTPLLNLGALGLGGLGASTLTKLGPLWTSVAGYMKSALPLAGIARNDTSNTKNKPYHMDEHSMYNHPMGPNFIKINSGGPPTILLDHSPQRPIVPSGAEPNYQLPPINAPNVYHHYGGSGSSNNNFPPNNYNFAPPHDNHPNMFAQFPEVSHPPRSSEVLHRPTKPQPGNSINSLRRVPSSAAPPRSQEQQLGSSNNGGQKLILPVPVTTQDTRTPPKLMTRQKFHETFQNRPYEILPAILDSDEIHSFEIVEPTGVLPSQRPTGSPSDHPSSTATGQSSKPPANIKEIINSDDDDDPEPTKPSITRNDKPNRPPLHHMDKVYYNNQEFKGNSNPENPFLTISVEKPPQTGNSANAPVRISFSSPGTHTGPAINIASHQHNQPPFHHHSQSMEHDSFVPPPRFPPIDSISNLPTPPPVARPTRMPINRGPTVPAPSENNPVVVKQSGEQVGRFPSKIQFPNQNKGNRVPFIPPMRQNIWTRLNGTTSSEIAGPIKDFLPPYRNVEGSENRPQFIIPNNNNNNNNSPQGNEPNRFMVPPNRNPLPNSINNLPHKPNPFNVPPNRRPIGPMKTVQEQFRPQQGPVGPSANSGERPFRPNFGSNEHPFRPIVGSHERPSRPSGSHEQQPPFRGSHENRGPIGPPGSSQEQHGPARRPVTAHENLRPPVLLPAMPMPQRPQQQQQPSRSSQEQQFRQPPQRIPIGPPMTSSEQVNLHSYEVVNIPASSNERPQIQQHHTDFGNSAQEQNQRPVLLPGFHELPWAQIPKQPPPQASKEKPSSLENHRLPSGFVRPMRPTGSVVRIPSTQTTPPTTHTTQSKLIIKEIVPPRAPFGGFRNISSGSTTAAPETTVKPPNRATISKLNFIRRFTTRPPSTTRSPSSSGNVTNFGKVNSFMISPTVTDLMKVDNSKDGGKDRLSPFGKVNNPFLPKRPQLSRFPFKSTTRKPFDATKYFTNVSLNDTNITHETGASEDTQVIIDPADESIIKSPFDKVDTVSFGRPTPPTTTTTTSKTTTTTMTSSEEIEAQEDKLLEKLKEAGFPYATPKDFDQLWWPTTFKPFPAGKISIPNRIPPSSTHKYDAPTTFRNTVKPTTFRPTGNRTTYIQGLLGEEQLIRNQLTRPGNNKVQYMDDIEGLESVKIKNVEIHKIPEFMKKPGTNSGEKDASEAFESDEYYDEEEIDIQKEPKPSQESVSEINVSSESKEKRMPGPPPPPVDSTERPDEDIMGNTAVPMPATALTPPSPPPNYLDPNNPRVRPPVGAMVHYSPNGPVPNLDLLRRPSDNRPENLPRPQPPQFNQQNLGLRPQFQPTLATDLHPPAPSNDFHGGFHHPQNGAPFDGRPPPRPPQQGRPGLIRRPIVPQRRPDFPPENRPEFNNNERPNGPPRRPDIQLRPEFNQGQNGDRPDMGAHGLSDDRNRPGPPPRRPEGGRPDVGHIGPDGRPRHPLRRPFPPRGNLQQQQQKENQGPPRQQGPVRRPRPPPNSAENRPNNNAGQRPQGPLLRRPGNAPFNRQNPFFRRPAGPNSQETTTESTTSSTTSTRRPFIPTRSSSTTKHPLDSQEYSDEDENESNEIIIDNIKSTTENQNIVVQNQQKSTTEDDRLEDSSSSKPLDLVPAAAGAGEKDSEEYSDEFEESFKYPTNGPISSEKNNNDKSSEKQTASPPPVRQSSEDSAKNSVERPQLQPPLLRRPIHAGGHINGHFRRPVNPQRIPPGQFRPQNRPNSNEARPSQESFDSQGQFRPQNRPNSNEARPSQESFDSSREQFLRPRPPSQQFEGPFRNQDQQQQRVRPGQQPPFRQPSPPGRPNLLRPHSDLFKPEPSPTPQIPRVTVHTIASVDDDNKIIGTNVFTAILPSRDIMKSESGDEIQATRSLSTELLLTTPALEEGESTLSPTSVIKYSSGTLQTVSAFLPEPSQVSPSEEDEYSGEYSNEDDDDDNDVRPPPLRPSVTRSSIRTRIRPTPTPELTSPVLVTSNQVSLSSVESTVISTTSSNSRFVFPTRKAFTRPPLVKTTPEPDETTASESKTITRRPFIPFRNVTVTVPWSRRPSSSTEKPSGTEIPETTEQTRQRNDTRKFPVRRPFVPFTTQRTSSTTSTTTEEPKTRPTTFRPFRRPGTFVQRNTTTTPSTTTTTEEPITESQEMEEAQHRPVLSSTTSAESTENDNEDEEDRTLKPDETKIVERVQTSVNFKINPTRVLHRGKPKGTGHNAIKTENAGEDDDTNTRFVTHTETQTQTITETERTVLTSQGQPVTQTVMITKTLPPQTLISTIVGTVTVVNSVEVKPTTVRTTIYTEPTIIIPAPPMDRDTTERASKHRPDGSVIPISRGNVVLAGNSRGPPSSTPTASLTTEESTEKGKIGPPELECISNCSHEKNQVCRRYANGTRSHCVCKPGYARLKPSIPCKPAFTYELSMRVANVDKMDYDLKDLKYEASDDYQNFIGVTKEALDKTFMKTDVRTKYMGAEVMKVMPKRIRDMKKNISESEVNVAFLVQLSLNVTEELIKQQFIRQLKTSNFTMAPSGIASSNNMSHYAARDFDECSHPDYNDCSKDADCINIKGSFTCKCRSGYLDRSRKDTPGRDCRAMDGCEECSYQGKCIIDPFGNPACHCFRWYGGSQCQVNLKVLLISIIVIGFVLFILVLLCGIMMCRRKKPQPSRERTGSGRFLRYRSPTSAATLDRAAIMNDSCSSDGSQTPTTRINPLPHSFTPDSLLVDTVEKNFMRESRDNVNLMNFSLRNVLMEQQDRSLTVVIPRAKIRPASRPPSRPTQSSLPPVPTDAASAMAANEQKLMRYLEQGPVAGQHHNQHGHPLASSSRQPPNSKAFRKLSLQEQRKISSGALVSSGTEVSAQGGMRRKSTGLPVHEHEPSFRPHEPEFRSFDQSYRPQPLKADGAGGASRRGSVSSYRCKPPSYCGWSESHGHTMNEKDGASTVYTTQGKLFRMSQDYDSNSLSD